MRRLLTLLTTLALLIGIAVPTHAAEPKRASKGLRAYGLDWIEAVPPDAFPPTRYAVCLVDSGVAITPDTPPDNPAGPIVRRLAIDGGSGEPQGTAPEQLHGTRMAMTSIAPRNNWGTVGMNPAGRIVSVRAMVGGETTFTVRAYTRAINDCLNLLSEMPIAAINLSIGCPDCQVDSSDLTLLQAAIARARDRGVEVVAAAGNRPGGVQFPANLEGVRAVAAGGNKGRLCAYGSWGPGVFALAPACPIVSADPLSGALEPRSDGGSSAASAQVAEYIATLRTLRPDIAPAQVVEWISGSSRSVAGRRAVSGRAAAGRAGLKKLMQRADRLIAQRQSGKP